MAGKRWPLFFGLFYVKSVINASLSLTACVLMKPNSTIMKIRHFSILILLVTLCLMFYPEGKAASSYPIDPRPLRRLVMESEFIVIGYVIRIDQEQDENHKISAAII